MRRTPLSSLGSRSLPTTIAELINRADVDLVDVCTPPDSHLAITMAALDAGKHVLCEKPIALDARQAEELRDRASELGIVHAVNHEMRYTPVRRKIRQLVAEGFLGEVQFVSTTVHAGHGTDPTKEPYYWGWLSEPSKGGGFLMGSLSHHIDLLRFTFGDISNVLGRTATLISERPVLTFEYRDGDPIGPETPTVGLRSVEADDSGMFTGTLSNGALVSMSGSWSLHHPAGIRLEAYGDAGALRLEADGRLMGARVGEEMQQIVPEATLPDAPDMHYLVPQFVALSRDVADAVAGRSKPEDRIFANFDDGYRGQLIIDEIRAHHAPVGRPVAS